MDVVKLFRERDTVDELGVGTARDAFSNYFFPGTSTIQTRAKYMLFIPWVYKKLENNKKFEELSEEFVGYLEYFYDELLLTVAGMERVLSPGVNEPEPQHFVRDWLFRLGDKFNWEYYANEVKELRQDEELSYEFSELVEKRFLAEVEKKLEG